MRLHIYTYLFLIVTIVLVLITGIVVAYFSYKNATHISRNTAGIKHLSDFVFMFDFMKK